jgi:hypothetical protein
MCFPIYVELLSLRCLHTAVCKVMHVVVIWCDTIVLLVERYAASIFRVDVSEVMEL